MQKIFIAPFFLAFILTNGLRIAGQTNIDTTFQNALPIAEGIIELVDQLTKDFVGVKGDFIPPVAEYPSGTNPLNMYDVKGMDIMRAEYQWIFKAKDGSLSYEALYETPESIERALSAFMLGVPVVVEKHSYGNYLIWDDEPKSSAKVHTYSLMLDGVRVGSFTHDTEKKQAILVIGFL